MARQEEGQEAEQENDRMGMMGEEEKDEVEKDEDPPRILRRRRKGIKGEEHKRGEKERCDYHFVL